MATLEKPKETVEKSDEKPGLNKIEKNTSVLISILGVSAEEKAKINGLYPVNRSGNVNLPNIGRVKAAGRTAEDLASEIEDTYRDRKIYRTPQIQVAHVITAGVGN